MTETSTYPLRLPRSLKNAPKKQSEEVGRVQERYKFPGFLRVPIASLQGIAVRPLPCNYSVFELVCALSRR